MYVNEDGFCIKLKLNIKWIKIKNQIKTTINQEKVWVCRSKTIIMNLWVCRSN